ncbi:gamma-glutamyltranspeptidase / glutathione hydrolase [Tistlia consotensis]|uniref:Gamma-glutamyltranspeptidase / glutathione hydrolase n=1 Tax=Tistlia consotensis USBA 355 TaxID=560819 RepID=A0A1Y6C7Y1_9PROT|nr:gamma-glutamyltransferase [Tistlia consotensis]SMF41206.1 gamma-glutamyltranspeptidase / glutathione hydrolase [Tistlia consotensis USBA 355]SNR73928.1 gamma-glutamyltranspeptidase / glutathione hydrolase [Tistlia consotensis]
MSSFSRSQVVRKPAVSGAGGLVAAQHRGAAEVGAEVLAAGGDALDAAVATSFALGVLEPWMSGPAGGGAMMLWRAEEQKAYCVFYGMRAPAGLDPADYPLSGGKVSDDLFPWAAVVDDRNVQGATAVAVPGLVDGIGLAHGRFGRLPWRELLQPAVGLARKGLLVDWYAALMIASATRILARDPDAAALFLEDGQWPTIAGWTALSDKRLDFSRMADTLAEIADKGPRELYDGEVGRALARDVQAKGGSLSAADLAAYHAELQEPLAIPYRGGRVFAAPRLTAGPTLADVLGRLSETLRPAGKAPDGTAYAAYAAALGAAYEKRLSGMGDTEGAWSGESPEAPACTTHFSVVDRQGNMAAVTQTLLSSFGARCVSPSTGLLLNNGIMWFDPEPGRPNSLAPGKRCLMNVCPVVGESGGADGRRFALGASGGRKIMPAVAQLSSFLLDYGMSLDEAFHQPRIDCSGGPTVVADEALPAGALAALTAGHEVVTTKRTVFPYAFACPAGVLRDAGASWGATEPLSPWGDAVAEA